MHGSQEPDFFIAEWRVRPTLGRLERGDVSISVEARSLQVLACLARHAPGVVSKPRLIREVWGEEAFVTEEVLSHAIWELRKALGDEARNPRYIQTIAKKGYRLLVEVSFGATPEPLATGCRIANYEILAPVGGGAMGEVYKARDLRLGRVVALKFLPADLARDPGARRRFLREAQAVALLDHPNVATLYEAGESEGGRVFLALAFYEGETLQEKLAPGPLPLAEALAIARQIAQGLAAAHRRQIVHRDVKPANVVVLPDGTVKLLDFGLAKMAGATTLTRLGSSPGTPAYKSPEQTRGEKVDPRSDLWALGVVLHEMVTGRVPFGGEYEQAVIYAILNERPRPLDGDGAFPSELAEVISRALEKDPAARYPTAEAMAEDLARVPLEASGEPVPRRPRRMERRPTLFRKWFLAGLAALVVLGIALGVWQWREHRWDFAPEVARLVEQGDRMEWRGDTERILHNAEGAYRQALARDRGNPLIEAQLAALLARIDAQFSALGRREEIRRLAARAVERAPDHPMPWVARAKLLLLENKPREAEQAAREAVEQDPEFDRGHTVLGEALIAQKRLEDGLDEIRRGVAVGQGYLRARLILAAKLQDASRYDEAATELHKVLAYDPDHPTANQTLGAIYLDNGRNSDALPLFRKAFELTRDARSANSLGFVYFNLDRMDEAIAAFREAYRLNPSLPTAARNLAESYEKIGQASEARRWYTAALSGFERLLASGGPRAELLSGRAYCAAKLGRYDEALGNVREAMKLKPKQNAFLFRAAQICAMAGRREAVYSYARQAVQEGYSREELRRDLAFRAFQDDPRFRTILESAAR
ncbi:MAG TPA: protein kinase [Thermoanaerobaculia bacterium]|nr:protein kinase [Thermoanaerobaculia bacterium]